MTLRARSAKSGPLHIVQTPTLNFDIMCFIMENLSKMVRFFITWHKWVSILLLGFILLIPVSGIILNHRKLFSSIDVTRSLLPDVYKFKNWNNAAVKGTEKIGPDSILFYGNIGIWLYTPEGFEPFMNGFPRGMDNRKICKIRKLENGMTLAGTLFGLYKLHSQTWIKVKLPTQEKRVVDITTKSDTIILLTRSHVIKTTDLKDFQVVQLPAPLGYRKEVSLFKTFWTLHSGELFGIVGKIFVDFMGLIFIFLVISGAYYFIGYYVVKFRRPMVKLNRSMRFLLKWHNKFGWTMLVFLFVVTITGMFLRPPFLILIANKMVKTLPLTTLNSGNPWYDRLRAIIYEKDVGGYIIATNKGIFFADENLKSPLLRFRPAPPINVMGVTVFEKHGNGKILVGSFDGLFLWNYKTGEYYDYIRLIPGYRYPSPLVTGYTDDFGEFYFDYDKGVKPIRNSARFPEMPEEIGKLPISLWNFALEIHTGRAYMNILKSFTILYIPLIGLILLSIYTTGFIVWWKLFR